MRAILRGEGLIRPLLPPPELQPMVTEVRARLRDLEDEFRRSEGLVTEWNPERLRALLHTQLRGDQVIVVSNREPYIHEHGPGGVIVKRPASGLVTAVEPVMRACSGTWIAHGSGSADREVVDAQRPPRRAAVGARLLAAPHLDDRRGGAGLLLRLCQRRAVAAVPRGPRAAGVPRVGLGAVPHHQPAFRRRGGAGGARRRPGGAGAGLPLRAAAADDRARNCRARPS